jgi:DNA-directed RNA polymerase specialized sigma24 family protein
VPPDIPVTHWLERLRAGDLEAADVLFRAYFERLARLARQHLCDSKRRLADEEDVALGALDSFFRGVAAERFPRLNDRNDLWRILLTLTLYKARDVARHESRQRRGGGRVGLAEDLFDLASDAGDALDRFASPEPPPDLAACFAEEVRHLLQNLPGDDLRRVALARLEGCTVDEVATRLGVSRRAVERKLHLIRKVWQSDAEQSSGESGMDSKPAE